MSVPADPAAVLASRLSDKLVLFLEWVAESTPRKVDVDARAGQEVILCLLARATSQLLMAGVTVLWQEGESAIGARQASGVGEPEVMEREDAWAALAGYLEEEGAEQRYSPLTMTWWRRGGDVVAIRIAAPEDEAGRLWFMRPAESEATASWRWFHTFQSGLRATFVTVRAIMQARAASASAAQRTEIGNRVKVLAQNRSTDIGQRFDVTLAMLDQIVAGNACAGLDFVEELAVGVLQALLGTGWTVRSVGMIDPGEPPPSRLAANDTTSQKLHRIIRRIDAALACRRVLRSSEEDAPRESHLRFVCSAINRTFRALLDQPDMAGADVEAGFEGLSLLPVWTRVHEHWRRLSTSPNATDWEVQEADAAWAAAHRATLRELSSLLVSSLQPRAPRPESGGVYPVSARNWLTLWFCLTVLRDVGGTPSTGGQDLWLLRANLAYVLREALRFSCFGARRDYFYQPATYAASMRDVVEYHAREVLKIPFEFKLRLLLDEIGGAGRATRFSAAEHLQHVLEVYMGGQFLLLMRIDVQGVAPGEPRADLQDWTLAEALSATGAARGGERAMALRQAYGIAALFHDMGHVIFQREPSHPDAASSADSLMQDAREIVENKLDEAGTALLESCLAELLEATYLDPREREAWQQENDPGGPNHGLLSAWYLHRVGQAALEDMADPGLLPDTLKAAVRAVLLHADATEMVRVERDPVASLLVFCDEIFEWDPDRALGPAPSRIGSSLHVMAADAPSREPRDRWIGIDGMSAKVRDAATGELDIALSIDGQRDWPTVYVGLQPPERLDVSIPRLWLKKAQSLGRIVRDGRGYGPTLVLRSMVHPNLWSHELTTRRLLELVANRRALAAVPELGQWLTESRRYVDARKRPTDVPPDSRTRPSPNEVIRLGPLERPLLLKDIHRWLSKIEREAADLLSGRR